MAIIDVELEIKKLAKTPEELDLLRKAAAIGLKSAVEDLEIKLNYCKNVRGNEFSSGYSPAYLAALESALLSLQNMLVRVEKGDSNYGNSTVRDF